MSDRVLQTMRIPVAGRRAVLEVEIVEPEPPGGMRQRVALRLIQLAGKLMRMRVRVVGPPLLLAPRELVGDAPAHLNGEVG